MLYGMDEDDYVKELRRQTQSKINVNKLILVAIILICIIVVGFIRYRATINKKENKESYEEQSITIHEENENIDEIIYSEESNNQNEKIVNQQNNTENQDNIEDQNKKDKKKNSNTYDGNHVQIAAHEIDKIVSKFVPQPNANAQNIIKDIYKSDEKQVFLTFDDGPSKDITPKILDILKDEDVKATFFVLGARVELYPETLKREYDEGHYIANHGYSHDYAQIYESKESVLHEYVQTENAIKNAIGNQDYYSYLFRFPGGSSGGKYKDIKSDARPLLEENGIAYTNWNCLTGDAEGKNTKEESFNEMIKSKEDQQSIILLMHDANDKQQTLDVLPDIIQYYKDEGYTFKTFYEIFK